MREDRTLTPPYNHSISSTMATIGFDNTHKTTKKVSHRRDNSSELDVFEAARYFSSIPDATFAGVTAPLKAMREERFVWSGGRRSLDMPLQQNPHHSFSYRLEKHSTEKKSKQPRSPGAKLASFLNSLFSQTYSKKKSKSSTRSMRDEEESPNGRRKRRSSISFFQTTSTKDSQSMHSSSSSGLRTPPPKVIRDVSLPRCNAQPRSVTVYHSSETFDEKKDLGWDQRFKSNDGFLENGRTWVDEILTKERSLKGGEKVEDGWESDSSSDLFELQNYDLGIYSDGLPVYKTTHVGPVKRAASMATGTL